jgi:arginase
VAAGLARLSRAGADSLSVPWGDVLYARLIGSVAVIGAPSAIGISPYREGGMRRLDLAPAALRDHGVIARLGATDLGDAAPPPGYADVLRPFGRMRNEEDVVRYSRELSERVVAAARDGSFVVMLGGDCSIMLGALRGLRLASGEPAGVVYIDAHADFATLDESPSGSACSMNLAIAVGRMAGPLAPLVGEQPLVRGEWVVHVGRRGDGELEYGAASLAEFGILDLPQSVIDAQGPDAVARQALERVSRAPGGFWVHFDVDSLDPELMPAVDSPLANGLRFETATALVGRLVSHPDARGLQVTIYDPSIDPSGNGASLLVELLERVLELRAGSPSKERST